MTEWEAIGTATEDFKVWWAEFGKRFEGVPDTYGYQHFIEDGAYRGFLAARGLDFERALAEKTERTKAELAQDKARLAELRAEA